MTKYVYKSIKFTEEDHSIISDLAQALQDERGGKVYLPGTVLEAVKFYGEHRNNPYIGGKKNVDSQETE